MFLGQLVGSMEVQKTHKKAWWIVEFDVEAKHEEMASWLMIQLGANGCQWISTKDGNVTLQASFELDKISPADLSPIYSGLDEYGLAAVIPTIRINKLEEEDWLMEWKKGIAPLPLGERLLICPPWLLNDLTDAERQSRLIIQIEPGMAFGTGFHFTTQFCLRAIEKYAGKNSGRVGIQQVANCSDTGAAGVPAASNDSDAATVENSSPINDADCSKNGSAGFQPASNCSDAAKLRLLDVGTGSGILAIASVLLLENAHVWACEIDPDACVVARENLELNKVDQQITVLEGSTETVSGERFDLVLSNLTCEDNVALLKDYVDLTNAGSHLIMSGILKEKLPILQKELEKHPFKIVQVEEQETWAGVVVERVK